MRTRLVQIIKNTHTHNKMFQIRYSCWRLNIHILSTTEIHLVLILTAKFLFVKRVLRIEKLITGLGDKQSSVGLDSY